MKKGKWIGTRSSPSLTRSDCFTNPAFPGDEIVWTGDVNDGPYIVYGEWETQGFGTLREAQEFIEELHANDNILVSRRRT